MVSKVATCPASLTCRWRYVHSSQHQKDGCLYNFYNHGSYNVASCIHKVFKAIARPWIAIKTALNCWDLYLNYQLLRGNFQTSLCSSSSWKWEMDLLLVHPKVPCIPGELFYSTLLLLWTSLLSLHEEEHSKMHLPNIWFLPTGMQVLKGRSAMGSRTRILGTVDVSLWM